MRRCYGIVAACLLAVAVTPVSAHMDPYVTFILRFVDKDGKPVSGLSASLEAKHGRSEAEIIDGHGKVALGFGRNYNGTLTLRVVDRKRRPVMLKTGTLVVDSLMNFPYAHTVGMNMVKNADFSNFLNDGTEYPSADGKIHNTAGIARDFRVDWLPGQLSPEDAEEARTAERLDANIGADLQRQLAEIRKKRSAAQ